MSYYEDLTDYSTSSDSSDEIGDESIRMPTQIPPYCSPLKTSSHATVCPMTKEIGTGTDVTASAFQNHARSSARYLLHMDVDCFYCQCECIDQNIPRDRPLAIGQKHIIVTCNYAARELGVRKLQLRSDALLACQHLQITEGSNLERYRYHARAIYQALRRACKAIHANVAVCRGSMDEATVDLTQAIVREGTSYTPYTVTELPHTSLVRQSIHIHSVHSEDVNPLSFDADERLVVTRCLDIGAQLAVRIRKSILNETGFTTTLGISTNPLLSKICSSLRKPGIVNVLYPWDGPVVISSKPVRSIPGFGSSLFRSLRPTLQNHFPERPSSYSWTCSDLLHVPVSQIEKRLAEVPSFAKTRSIHARKILDRCRGLDDSRVRDDGGRPPLVISTENSFRRGTICSVQAVESEMHDLYHRLSRLLQDRWMHFPTDFPKTIRLTLRYVAMRSESMALETTNEHGSAVKSSVIVRQQTQFDRQRLLQAPAVKTLTVSDVIQSSVVSMLKSMLSKIDVNVTRINICLADFQRSSNKAQLTCSVPPLFGVQVPASAFTSPSGSSISSMETSVPSFNFKQGSVRKGHKYHAEEYTAETVDPAILAELPTDLQQEILQAIHEQSSFNAISRSQSSQNNNTIKRTGSIESYFTPKRRKISKP